jgi:hypothetical protein
MSKVIEQKEVYVIKNLDTESYYESENIFRSSTFHSTKNIAMAFKFVEDELDYVKEIINKYPDKKLVVKKIRVIYEEVEE